MSYFITVGNEQYPLDDDFKRVYEDVGPLDWSKLIKPGYPALICAIIGQKISYNRAKKLRSNLYTKLKLGIGDISFTLDDFRILSYDDLKDIGLDDRCISTILAVNTYLSDHLENKLQTVDDIEQLINIKGVGKWTVKTTILTAFLDQDTFPEDDYFIQKRLQRLFNLDKKPTAKQAREISQRWKPYRTLVTWYLWRWF